MPTIQQLPAATSVAATDLLPLSQGGTTKGLSVGNLLSSVQPALSIAPSKLLGRVSATAGGPEVVAIGTGLTIAAGSVAATGADHTQLPISPGLQAGDEVVVNVGGLAKRMQASLLRSLFVAGSGISIDNTGTIAATGGSGATGVSTFNARSGTITLTSADVSAAGGALVTGLPTPATITPLVDGVAAVGTSPLYARQDHVHPSDPTRLGVANNLSDVANAVAARSNLGLGGAAVLNVGTVTGTVAAGDDARITGAQPAATVGAAAITATGATAPRSLAARAADVVWLSDFLNADGTAVDTTGGKDVAFALSAALAVGNVRIAPGTYLLASAVSIPARAVGLFGSGWGETPGHGTWFKITSTGFNPFNSVNCNHLTIKDIAFQQAQPVPGIAFTPTPYPAIITLSAGMLDAENLFFYGCTAGILLTGGSFRHRLRRISGQTFGPMIEIDQCTDTMVIDDVHHWPYWSLSVDNSFSLAQQNAIYNYQTNKTDVILSKRNDDPYISKIFGYGVRSAIHFENNTGSVNPGATGGAYVADVCADAARYAFLVTAANTTLTANRVQSQSYDPASATLGILAGSAGVMIDDALLDGSGTGVTGCIVNLQGFESSESDYGALVNFGTYNTIRFSDPIVRAWDRNGSGHYAIQGRAGSGGNVVQVSNPLYLLAPASGNTIDAGQLIAPAGSTTLPGLQVGDSLSGLAGDADQVAVVVNARNIARFSNPSPNAANGDVLFSADTGAVYLTLEGTQANYNLSLLPKGSGAVVVPSGSATSPGVQVGPYAGTGIYGDTGDLGLLVSGNQGLRVSTFVAGAHWQIGGSADTVYLVAEGTTPNIGVDIVAQGAGTINLSGAGYTLGGVPIGSIYATLVSPGFTGVPTAPTAVAGTSTTQLATTAFVVSAMASASPGNTGNVVTSGSSYVMASTDRFLVIRKTVGASINVTLPTSPPVWVPYVVKDGKGDASVNKIVIQGATIDGQSSFVIAVNYGTATFVFNGTDWSVI